MCSDAKIRLCHAILRLEEGGQGRIVCESTERLSRSFPTTIVTGKVVRHPPTGVQVREKHVSALYYLPIRNSSLIRLLGQYDIIHCHSFPYILSAKKTNKPVVLTVHGITPWKLTDKKMKLRMLISERLAHFVYSSADVLIAISDFIQTWLKKRYGVNSIKIPNGINTNNFRPMGQTSVARMGDPMLLYVGEFSPKKGVDQLVKAMPQILRDYPRAVLNLIGFGPLKEIKRLARTLGICGSLNILGYVAYEQLPLYYNACDVFVTASKWEGFGMPLVEAFACGKAVVARDAYAMAEHVKNSKAGRCFRHENDLTSAITNVLTHKDKYELNARKYATQFSWERIIPKLEKVYFSLLER